MYGSQSIMPHCHTCLLFSGFSNVYHSAFVWPTALKLGCVTNLDTLFLVMGLISLVDEIQFMLISSRHICIRSNEVCIMESDSMSTKSSKELYNLFSSTLATPIALAISDAFF